ncbi:MAG: ABC transporter permease [Spirochaetes bacterium]|nr:ABC transporter permease [Spirochaetota bacterium]
MAKLTRIWTLFMTRNREFFRDRSTLAWNVLFPVLVIVGFSFMFGQGGQSQYKIGLVGGRGAMDSLPAYERFGKTRYMEFLDFPSAAAALERLRHHRVDLVLDPAAGRYWTSSTSPKGYVATRLLSNALRNGDVPLEGSTVSGVEIPYIEWLFPGILGMNMMFSALFGVGYVVVQYRKNGALKRLSVTPVRPHEFLTAQVLSRMFILMSTTAIVYGGCALLYGFRCRGSYLALVLLFFAGGFSMVSLGLLVASRSSSEEFANGILNLISWPMMFTSEVWFSLEGANPWVRWLSKAFPLTYMIEGVRRVMNDGAGLAEVSINLAVLAVMSLCFLAAGSLLFVWQKKG